MSFLRDRQIRMFVIFMALFGVVTLIAGVVYSVNQSNAAKNIYISHDEAIASSLLKQGVSKEVIANALTNTDIDPSGKEMLFALGIGSQAEHLFLPFVSQFQRSSLIAITIGLSLLLVILFTGTLIFFWRRKCLYLQAEHVIEHYINGDCSCHLPQNREGSIFLLFASVEQLATMLQSKNDTEHKAKNFFKNTISDISHQLRTPLAAITMYQEIITEEPNNEKTVRAFSEKIGIALRRMEQLIQSMLKITRLDTGNILFKKQSHRVTELTSRSISELADRAVHEKKQLILDGDSDQFAYCDLEWTSEALGNIVKNALDHTDVGDIIRITWEHTPTMLRIMISDTGSGIASEDIHHIFKRFYRSKHSLSTQGIGLGLSLAKSIIEGQGGMLFVQSEPNEGTTFTIALLTES